MQAGSAAIADRKAYARSRVGNGSTFLPSVDGRSVWARLARDTFDSLLTHCGGADAVSETRRMMARRCASLEAELVYLEDAFAKTRAAGGEPEAAQVDLYSRLSNTQRRLAEALGWDRTAKDITPSPAEYFRAKAAAEAASAAEPVSGTAPAQECASDSLSANGGES